MTSDTSCKMPVPQATGSLECRNGYGLIYCGRFGVVDEVRVDLAGVDIWSLRQ